MKPIIRELLVFGSGAIVGFILANEILKTKYEAIVQEEIESVREHVKARTRRSSENGMTDEEYEANLSVNESFATEEELAVLAADRERRKEMKRAERELAEMESPEDDGPVDYTKFSKNVFDEIVDPDEFTQKDCEDPYVIDFEDFSDRDEYDKVTLSYYEDDEVVTEENDEVVVDIDDLVGDGLSYFDGEDSDPDTVYVRNEKKMIDYEIIRLHKSYQTEVLGIPQKKRYKGTPAKRDPKRADVNE